MCVGVLIFFLRVQSGLKFAKLWDAGETGLVELVLA